jgi:hypothetical protein
MSSEADDEQIYREFHDAVNMAPKEIEDWLDTEASREVGYKEGSGESVGHASGKRIVEILRTKKADLSDADRAHMRKVVGYVHRHCAQGPGDKADVAESRWRYSLMNWGHDPLKK